jgi:ubiquinone/menaquinone biosynthesis C-methylase UbiE
LPFVSDMPSDSLATLWEAYAASRERAALEIREVLDRRRGARAWPQARVLDLGCGDGAIAEGFAAAGARVVAMDLDPWRVANTAERASARPTAGFAVIAADGHALPYRDGVFDVVILSDLIEHVRDPRRVMREVARVLGPGGVAYASIPNRLSLVNLVSDPHYNVPAVGMMPRWLGAWCVTRLFRVSHQYTVERYSTWRGARRLFAEAGLASTYVEGWYETRLRQGVVPMAPARRWLVRLSRWPGVRRAVLSICRTGFFRQAVLPAWQFVAAKPAG